MSATVQEEAYMAYLQNIMYATTSSGVCLMLWEWGLHLPFEIQTWRKTPHVQPIEVCVLIIRWCTLGVIASGIPLILGNPGNCEAANVMLYTFYAITQSTIGAVFFLRTYALYQKSNRQWVTYMFAIVWIILVGSWFASIGASHADQSKAVKPMYGGGSCYPARTTQRWKSVAWLSAVVYDFATLLATFIRLAQAVSKWQDLFDHTYIANTIIRTSLLFFIPSTVINVTTTLFDAFGSNALIQAIPVPVAYALNSVLACRLVYSMKASKETRGQSGSGGQRYSSSENRSRVPASAINITTAAVTSTSGPARDDLEALHDKQTDDGTGWFRPDNSSDRDLLPMTTMPVWSSDRSVRAPLATINRLPSNEYGAGPRSMPFETRTTRSP